MAAKSVLKSSVSALFALALGTAALLPASASAQERGDRGERGAGRMERTAPPAMPSMPRPMDRAMGSTPTQAPAWQNRAPSMPAQAPSWQNRAPSGGPQGGGWGGRPNWPSGGAQGSQAPQQPRMPSGQDSWNGRPAWQGGNQASNQDRERGDRGNGGTPNGQPTFQRPGWPTNGVQGSQVPQRDPSKPSWGSRNPTYVDPSRGGSAGLPADGRGQRWNQDRQGRWYHSDNGEWRQDRGGKWYRDGDRADSNRDDWRRRRGNNGWGNNGWGNNGWGNNRWDNNRWNNNRWGNNRWNNGGWGYNNGWNNGYSNGYANGYSNGWRSWDRDSWRRDNRYDWYGWRGRHRSTFSLGIYYAPWQDYSYNRFGIGVVIGQPFYDERYWIADPWAYRLPAAYGPYRWVRYYDDALLVDLYSGEVVDAVYDIFW